MKAFFYKKRKNFNQFKRTINFETIFISSQAILIIKIFRFHANITRDEFVVIASSSDHQTSRANVIVEV